MSANEVELQVGRCLHQMLYSSRRSVGLQHIVHHGIRLSQQMLHLLDILHHFV